MWRYFAFRQPITEAKFITKSSWFILLIGDAGQAGLKPDSEQKLNYIRRPSILPRLLAVVPLSVLVLLSII